MTSRVREQIEQIIDEGHGRKRRVIVQMPHFSETAREWLEAASETSRCRALATSARDVLPPPQKYYERTGGKLKPNQRRHLRAAQQSLSANIAISSGQVRVRRPSGKNLEAAGESAVKALRQSDVIQKVLADKASAEASRVIWSAGAMSTELTKDQLTRLAAEVPEIVDVFPNRTVRLPTVAKAQSLPANVADNKASSWGVQAIGAPSVWGAYGARGNGITVAVLDTGIDPTHPDLAGKIDAFQEFDSNGAEVPGAARDSDEHGTHVAGTIAGGNQSGQWIGVAPDARIAAGLVLPGGGGTIAQILAGMDWAIAQGVDVINMSLGDIGFGPLALSTYTRTILTAAQSGIPVVASIGNDGNQTSGAPGNDFFAYAVGATDSADRSAGFSGGRSHIIEESDFIRPEFLPLVFQKPNVSAPGVAIRSAVPGGGYDNWNGTSMAAPHVAGAMALLLSGTNLQSSVPASDRAFVLSDLVTGSTEELGEAGHDHRYGLGRIDVLRAVGLARESGF